MTYSPDLHDRILRRLHADWKLTDDELAVRMNQTVRTIRDNRERLGLPANRSPWPATPKPKPDALSFAQAHLPGFNRERMTLNGRPVKLDEVMRLTNGVLVSKGLDQVVYNELWRV